MSIKTFIDRPILSGVISVAIVIVGLIGLSQLPIEQFPDIAPPTVRVSATYTGANAETVMKSVITPLEEQLNGVENMMYMTSTATNTGSASISVYFKQGTDPDMSVVNVQNRVASAQGLLPAEVTKSGITVRKRQSNSLKAISLYSPDDSYDANFLTNYMKINIEPRLSRIAGVGDVNIWGASYSMRIWLDPLRMAQYGLMPSDITAVLAEQNVESPTGTLGAESAHTFQYVLKYRGRYEEEEDYGNMVIKSLPDGDVLRLKDVARIEMGAENYAMSSQTSGHPGANCMMAQTSGSNANEIIQEIDKVTADISASLPKDMVLTDITSTKDFLDALNQRPEISRAYTTFATKYPQYRVEVDAALCKRNGISPTTILNTLAGYVGGSYSSNLNRFTKLYRVMVQAAPEYRLDTEALNNIFVRNSNGEMSPISQYLTLTRVYGSESLSRFNLFSAISVSGVPANGYSSGQALKAIEEVAKTALPEGYGYEFGGMSREEASTGNTTTLVFIVCIVFIYLILCALYESLMIPFAVILSVPFGLTGSFLFAKLWGLENNIYMQTGLIMLIGLLAKTAILLTEYASERRRQGMSLTTAAMSAAKARLRPILMTSMTMIFGMLPLMFAHGVGANGNISVGVGTVGGMLLGTAGLLFVVPSLFIIFQYMEEHLMPQKNDTDGGNDD